MNGVGYFIPVRSYHFVIAVWRTETPESVGDYALFVLDTSQGFDNTAVGYQALRALSTGSGNTAIGYNALDLARNGAHDNIAIGYYSGVSIDEGSNNIDIGNMGQVGDSATIRIGTVGAQTATFIAGISGVPISHGIAVGVNPNGQLGVRASSPRYKEAIQPMDKASEAILALKPVTFRYKKEIDPDRTPQFGLIAEEVEKVNPDLVARDDQGKPFTVRYEAVNAMLLNEFLKEHRKNEEQESKIEQQEAKIARQQKQIEALAGRLQTVSAQIELSKAAPQTALNDQQEATTVKYWEIIADRLRKAGFSWGCVSAGLQRSNNLRCWCA